jgi:hypothetical protein
VHRFRGIGLAIFTWQFADAGTHVAYGQAVLHASCSTHYELRDIRTERLIDSLDVLEPDSGPPLCEDSLSAPPVKIPKWVSNLLGAQKQ